MSEKETELPENWEDEIDWGEEEEEESSPPEAASTDEAPAEAPLPFHNVTPVKLAVLSFVTLGLYPLVWFYKNWVTFSRYRDGAPRRAVALARTVFSGVLYWDLAGQIDAVGRKAGVAGTTRPLLVGALFFGMLLLWRLPDPYYMLGLLSFLPLVPASVQIGRVHAALRPGVDTRVGWGVGAWIALLLGGALWTLALTGKLSELLVELGS